MVNISNLKEESDRKEKDFYSALKPITEKFDTAKEEWDNLSKRKKNTYPWMNENYLTPFFGDTKTKMGKDGTSYNPIPISKGVLGEKDKGICLKFLDEVDKLFDKYLEEYKNLREEYENLAANETSKDDFNSVNQVIAVANFFNKLDEIFITMYDKVRGRINEGHRIILGYDTSEKVVAMVAASAFGKQSHEIAAYGWHFLSECQGYNLANCGLAGIAHKNSKVSTFYDLAVWLVYFHNLKERINKKTEQLGKFKEILKKYNIAKKKFEDSYEQVNQSRNTITQDKNERPPPEMMSDEERRKEIEAIKRKLQLINEQEEAIKKNLEVTTKQIDDKIARLKALNQKSKTIGLTDEETQEMNKLLGGVPEGGKRRTRRRNKKKSKKSVKSKRRRRHRTKRRKVSKKSRKRRRRRTRK